MSAQNPIRWRAEVAFIAALARCQIKSTLGLRGAFFSAAFAMLLNDLIFFVVWWVIMQRFGQVRGWRLEDVACLYGLSAAGYGTCVVVFGGVTELSRRIDDGDLDALLTQPRSVLFQLLASRSMTAGWGDIVAGAALLAASGYLHLYSLPWVIVATLCSAAAFTACGVVVHSLAFWLGRIHSLSRSLWELTLTFGMYPPPLFDGAIRFLLFSLLPAGLVSYLPVELIRSPSAGTACLTIAAIVAYACFAAWLFQRGLRRYASGSRLTLNG
jgi:ABC-2 type transport system permease protein